jgi:predicted membrane GTPase involved in stress response
MRENGSLVAFETGQVTAYAIETAQERGQLFCRPGDQVGATRSAAVVLLLLLLSLVLLG